MAAFVPSASDDISMSMEISQEAAEILKAEDTDAALIDVEDLVTDMKRMLDDLRKSEPYTFHRVPVSIRKGNKKLYDPMSFAIGPYHHGRKHLRAMEKHKLRYLQDLLSRSTKANLEDCLRKMKTLEDKARGCYIESTALKSDEFVKMMVLDSCFIIEFFCKYNEIDGFNSNMSLGCGDIMWDLLLIENQIPLFVIEELFKLVIGRSAISSSFLNMHVQPVFLCYIPYAKLRTTETPPATILHLLDYFYHMFVPTEEPSKSYHRSPLLDKLISLPCFRFRWMSEESENSRKLNILIPSASVLHEAGVIFQKKNSPRSNLDITFRNGLMEIPFFKVEDSTKPLFTNLIAFEQSMPNDEPKTMTSFCLLMNSLINTEKDVALLQQCGIMDLFVGSEEEVARFFNQLGVYAVLDPKYHYFSELFREVNCYHNVSWNRYKARLRHDYFSNPWAILSLVAALILLALTFLQTFFAMDSYFHPP